MLIGRSVASRRGKNKEGEGYLASSADLMIGILFIFIIMVVYLAVEIKRVKSENGRSADPVHTLVKELGQRLKDEGVMVQLDPDSGVIALPADALFDKGKSVPKPSALDTISKTNQILSAVVPCYVNSASSKPSDCAKFNQRGVRLETVMVEGHTDSDAYANDPNQNWHLGLDRARYIFNALEQGELGALKNAKGQPILGVSSYAATRPSKMEVSSQDSKAKDRRVELRFILSYQGDGSAGPASEVIRAIEKH